MDSTVVSRVALYNRRHRMIAMTRTILILLLVTLQLASMGLVSAPVLCMGRDGHLAVELVHEACSRQAAVEPCCPESAGCPVMASTSTDCNDLPLPDHDATVLPRDIAPLAGLHLLIPPLLATGDLLAEPVALSALPPGRSITVDSYLPDEPVHRTLLHLALGSITLLI